MVPRLTLCLFLSCALLRSWAADSPDDIVPEPLVQDVPMPDSSAHRTVYKHLAETEQRAENTNTKEPRARGQVFTGDQELLTRAQERGNKFKAEARGHDEVRKVPGKANKAKEVRKKEEMKLWGGIGDAVETVGGGAREVGEKAAEGSAKAAQKTAELGEKAAQKTAELGRKAAEQADKAARKAAEISEKGAEKSQKAAQKAAERAEKAAEKTEKAARKAAEKAAEEATKAKEAAESAYKKATAEFESTIPAVADAIKSMANMPGRIKDKVSMGLRIAKRTGLPLLEAIKKFTASATDGKSEKCVSFNVPNLGGLDFDITEFPPFKIPNKEIKICPPKIDKDKFLQWVAGCRTPNHLRRYRQAQSHRGRAERSLKTRQRANREHRVGTESRGRHTRGGEASFAAIHEFNDHAPAGSALMAEEEACEIDEIRGKELATDFLNEFMRAFGLVTDEMRAAAARRAKLRGGRGGRGALHARHILGQSNGFDRRTGLVLGAACNGIDSFGIQLTTGTGAEGAYGAGGHAGVEVGIQFGCMDFAGTHVLSGGYTGKRFVLAPVWGFSGGLSVGVAASEPGLNINLGFSMPFGYYESVGHNLNLGVGGGADDFGGSGEVWFGCCTSPTAGPKKAVPLELILDHWSMSTPTVDLPFGLTVPSAKFDLYYPTYPFVSMTPVGGAGSVSLSVTGRRLLRATSDQTKGRGGDRNQFSNSTLMQADATIQVIYSRVCRRFFDGCMDSFQ